MKVSNRKSHLAALMLCFLNFGNSQSIKPNVANEVKFLTGNFILYRDEISQKDSDNIQPREFYEKFYVGDLSKNILSNFMELDSFSLSIFCINKPWSLVIIDDDIVRDSIYKLVGNYTSIKEMDAYNIFDTKCIPKNIIANNYRFMAVFQGRLAAFGPFSTLNSTPKLRQMSYGYLYLKNSSNYLKYLYTIVLPSKKTEE